jgi:hypothetical protein
MKFRSYLLPRNGLDLAFVDLSPATFCYLSPSLLDIRIRVEEILQEEARKLGAICIG